MVRRLIFGLYANRMRRVVGGGPNSDQEHPRFYRRCDGPQNFLRPHLQEYPEVRLIAPHEKLNCVTHAATSTNVATVELTIEYILSPGPVIRMTGSKLADLFAQKELFFGRRQQIAPISVQLSESITQTAWFARPITVSQKNVECNQ
jgi:hypothetical protein